MLIKLTILLMFQPIKIFLFIRPKVFFLKTFFLSILDQYTFVVFYPFFS